MMNGLYYLPQDFCDVLSGMFAECMLATGTNTNASAEAEFPGAYKLVSEESKAYGFTFDIDINELNMNIKVSGILNRVHHYDGVGRYVMFCMQLPFGSMIGQVNVFVREDDSVAMYLKFS